MLLFVLNKNTETMASIISIAETKKLMEARTAVVIVVTTHAPCVCTSSSAPLVGGCKARITGDKSNAKSFIYKQCTNKATQPGSLCDLCFDAKNKHCEKWKAGATTKKDLQHVGKVRKDQYPNYGGVRGHGWHGIIDGSIPYFARSNGADAAKAIKEPEEYSPEASRKFGYE